MKIIALSIATLSALTAPVMSRMPPMAPMAGDAPHYYGPYPNYANSQLTLPNALVTLSNDSGVGATASAIVNPAYSPSVRAWRPNTTITA